MHLSKYDDSTGPEVLQDGKNDWRAKRLMCEAISELFDALGDKRKAEMSRNCATYLEFKHYENGEKRCTSANLCHLRMCAMCGWRRSKKFFGQVSQCMDWIQAQDGVKYRFVFLTLTVRNCRAPELSATLDGLMRGFSNLTKKKRFKDAVSGFFRALEVTYDWHPLITKEMVKDPKRAAYFKKRGLGVGDPNPNYDTYHPHFHVILAVSSSYFGGSGGKYIPKDEWLSMWRAVMELDYTPSVDVRTVKPDKPDAMADIGEGQVIAHRRAVAEVAKYTVKTTDWSMAGDKAKEVVGVLDGALRNRRLVAFGGIFMQAKKACNLDDAEDGDLVVTGDEAPMNPELEYVIVRFLWFSGPAGVAGDYYRIN